MAAKEKINLLEVIPCLNIRGCNASLCRKECRKNFM